MKTKLLIGFLLISSAFVSCKEEKVDLTPPKGTGYVQLKFIDNDGTFETSGIHVVRDQNSTFRTNEASLPVSGSVVIYDGTYNIEVEDSAEITIAGDVIFKNINPKNKSTVKVIVKKDASLGIASSLNMNGSKYIFDNWGTVVSSSVEMQNSENVFNNYGLHSIVGDLQLLNEKSNYNNYGVIKVSNHTQLNGAGLNFFNCGTLETYGLNVNRENSVTGKGFIKVTGNLNVNKSLSSSKNILFCYDGRKLNKNEEDNLQGITRTCENTCIPDPMPIKYERLVIKRISNNIEVRFNITESFDLASMEVNYSEDGKTWKVIGKDKGSNLIKNTTYAKSFEIIK